MNFDGETFDQDRDGERLARQMQRVATLMSDGSWKTLVEIALATGYPEASISARIRDLRKERYGSRTVDRRYYGRGLWQYRLVPRDDSPLAMRLPL